MKAHITSERPNLFEPNVYIAMVAKIQGSIPAENAAEAVRAAYAANESTMSKIVLAENGNAYFQRLEESGCRIAFDSRSWKEILKESEKQTFHIKDGELIRTFIITEKDGLTLLIHAHHLVGDGKSILVLLSDILHSLKGNALPFKPMVLIDRGYLEKRARLPIGVKMFVNHMNRKWDRKKTVFGWDEYYAVHKQYWSRHSSEFEITTRDVKELKKRCGNAATINSLLITEMLQNRPDSCVTGIPVSIREENESMSNQTSGIAVNYRYDNRKPFEENLRSLHKRIYEKLRDNNAKYFVLLFVASLCPSLVDSVLLQAHGCYADSLSEKMAEIMGYTDKNSRDIGVTNLGVIDVPAEFDDFQVTDVLFIPPKISYAKEVAGVSTLGDKLTICLHKVS